MATPRRGIFHQYMVTYWPPPRGNSGSGDTFYYNFGSDRYMLLLSCHGNYYEVMVINSPEAEASRTQDIGWAGSFDVGSIAEVAAEAEGFMRTILREEGKDEESFC